MATVGACSKKKDAPVAALLPAADTASAATNAAMPAPAADGQVDVAEIQRSVIRWIVSHHARPADFAAFAASADMKIPPPPAGKKFILTPDMHVKVVDR